jgi:hypothetical protein
MSASRRRLAGGASCTFSVLVFTQGVGPMTNTTTNITVDGGLKGALAQASTYSSIAYSF